MPTPNLGLPFIAQGQAQKEVTHNEALRILDVLVQLAVLDRDLSAPPGSPSEGQRWIVGASPTGAWAGHANHIAAWQDGGWQFSVPKIGWLAYVVDESSLLAWDGSAWVGAAGAIDLQNLARLGVGTEADATNPFAAKLNNALWVAKTVAEGGDGNLRYKFSKASADKTASLLFQDNFSGRAEIGLTGDDDFHFKVSPDGAAWLEALRIDRASGRTVVRGLAQMASGATLAGMIFTPGGAGQNSMFFIDAASGPNPRTASIASVAADVITLTTAMAATFFNDVYMRNVSYVRIWNMSKTPPRPAWVKAQPTASQLQVLDAAAILGWAAGETVQVGDPESMTPGGNKVMALDISPMMQNLLGAVFPQRGIMVKGNIQSPNVFDAIHVSADGSTGSFGIVAVAYAAGGICGYGVTVVPCTQPSPVSNSNLVFVREEFATTATIRLLSALGLFA